MHAILCVCLKILLYLNINYSSIWHILLTVLEIVILLHSFKSRTNVSSSRSECTTLNQTLSTISFFQILPSISTHTRSQLDKYTLKLTGNANQITVWNMKKREMMKNKNMHMDYRHGMNYLYCNAACIINKKC